MIDNSDIFPLSPQESGKKTDPWADLLDGLEDLPTVQTAQAPPKRPQRLIALTGGIGSGKSLIGDYLMKKGLAVIDADTVVHQLLRENLAIQEKIRAAFGPDAFDEDTRLPSRPKLAKIIFQDENRRRLLESWLHPAVRAEMAKFCQGYPETDTIVHIIPLLFESSLENNYPEVWLIASSEEDQSQRLQRSRQMTVQEAEARLRAQMPFNEKHRRLIIHPNGHVILNTSTPEELFRQIDELLLDF